MTEKLKYLNDISCINDISFKMATFTVSIPKELKEEMDQYPEINLAEYLKKKFSLRLKELSKFEELRNKGAI